MMRVMLATIALNEEEWLPRLYEQHKDWPGLVAWCFVEGADPIFRETNPDMVGPTGLSIDNTSNLIRQFSKGGIAYGIHAHNVPRSDFGRDQNKCYLRNLYLKDADIIRPDIIITIDCDEFYTRDDQRRINDLAAAHLTGKYNYHAIMLKQRHIWRPEQTVRYMCAATMTPTDDEFEGQLAKGFRTEGRMVESPALFSQEVVGGYWATPHTRVWRYVPGIRHIRNHNWPEFEGEYLTKSMLRCDLMQGMPECIHMGFASSSKSRAAKASYYRARGEGSEGGRLGKKRTMYAECRDAHLNYRDGDTLPHGARVIPYTGCVPECFRS